MIEWDERKRLANLSKHGLDFLRAADVFDGRPVVSVRARIDLEPRELTVALLDDVPVAVVWTWRGSKRRIISMKSARREERRAYRDLFG